MRIVLLLSSLFLLRMELIVFGGRNLVSWGRLEVVGTNDAFWLGIGNILAVAGMLFAVGLCIKDLV